MYIGLSEKFLPLSAAIIAIGVIFCYQINYLNGNTLSTTTEAPLIGDGDEAEVPCSDEFPDDFCSVLIRSESCEEAKSSEDSPLRRGCRKTCGFCDEVDNNEDKAEQETTTVFEDVQIYEIKYKAYSSFEETRDGIIIDDGEAITVDDGLDPDGGKCEDKLPDCSKYVSVCCSMKDAMNASCPKTCRFCTETPSAPAPLPPGAGSPGGSSQQDPCGSTDPPSVTVDAPGQGTTTTTLAPVTAGTLPPVGR